MKLFHMLIKQSEFDAKDVPWGSGTTSPATSKPTVPAPPAITPTPPAAAVTARPPSSPGIGYGSPMDQTKPFIPDKNLQSAWDFGTQMSGLLFKPQRGVGANANFRHGSLASTGGIFSQHAGGMYDAYTAPGNDIWQRMQMMAMSPNLMYGGQQAMQDWAMQQAAMG